MLSNGDIKIALKSINGLSNNIYYEKKNKTKY